MAMDQPQTQKEDRGAVEKGDVVGTRKPVEGVDQTRHESSDRRGGGMWKHAEVKKEWTLKADGNVSHISRADQTCFWLSLYNLDTVYCTHRTPRGFL